MSRQVPGVSFSEEIVTLPSPQDVSAVPVFIGYTLSGEIGRLLVVGSWEEFLSEFCSAPTKVDATLEESALYQSLRLYFDNGGSACYVLPAEQLDNVGTDDASVAAQLNSALNGRALADDSAITLLCVPDIVLLTKGYDFDSQWRSVWQTMLDVSRTRCACFALLDLPNMAENAVKVLTGAQALSNAEFGAAYWPQLECTYLKDEARVVAPASGAVAALVQRTDRERGVWKAPANEALLQVVKPEFSQRQSGEVFDQVVPVNLIRSFPGRGVRVWGCQTLTASTTSPWRYLQVRRLLGHVEARLGALARFCVFEPNNEITWLKLKSLCRSWLHTLWLNGALFGASEEEAFRLLVGLGESMTHDDLLAGQLIVRVELSALYPAEYIALSLRFNMMPAQAGKEQV